MIDKRYVYVIEVDEKYAPRTLVYCLANGKTSSLKIQKKIFSNNIFASGDILFCHDFEKKKEIKYVDGEYVDGEKDQWWLKRYKKISREEFAKSL